MRLSVLFFVIVDSSVAYQDAQEPESVKYPMKCHLVLVF